MGEERKVILRDWYWLLGAAKAGGIHQNGASAKRYFEGLVLVNVCSRDGGDSAECGTERNCMLRE